MTALAFYPSQESYERQCTAARQAAERATHQAANKKADYIDVEYEEITEMKALAAPEGK